MELKLEPPSTAIQVGRKGWALVEGAHPGVQGRVFRGAEIRLCIRAVATWWLKGLGTGLREQWSRRAQPSLTGLARDRAPVIGEEGRKGQTG